MTKNTKINGTKIRIAVTNSTMTREKVVVLVQDMVRNDGLSFSLAGLFKLYEGELPRRDGLKVLDALSKALGCKASDFMESKARTA